MPNKRAKPPQTKEGPNLKSPVGTGFKPLPGVPALDENSPLNEQKHSYPSPWDTASASSSKRSKKTEDLPDETLSSPPDPSSINIWNEPVNVRRRQRAPSPVETAGLHERIKTKLSQAQQRIFNSSTDIPAPPSLASLIKLPAQEPPLSSESTEPLSTSLDQPSLQEQTPPHSQPQHEQPLIQQTRTNKQLLESKQPKPEESEPQPQLDEQNTQSSYKFAYPPDKPKPSARVIKKAKEFSISDQAEEQQPKIVPRRPRSPLNADSLAAIVPRLECLSHSRVGSATRRAEWPKCDLPQVCFVGRTNSGKSSLLNQFFRGRHLAKSSSRPGVTTALDFYNVDERVALVDTPGYGTNLNAQARNRWEAMVKEFLKYSPHLKMVCLLMDITNLPTDDDLSILRLVQARCGRKSTPPRSREEQSGAQTDPNTPELSTTPDPLTSDSPPPPPSPEQARITQMMKDIQMRHAAIAAEIQPVPPPKVEAVEKEKAKDHAIPVLLILTKDDHVTHDQRANLVHRIKRRLQWSGPFLCYSIKDRRGRGKLLRHIMTTLYQPENSLLLQDMLRPDFVPYGSSEHRGLLKKDNREAHWHIKQREEVEAKKAGLSVRKKKKKIPSQDGPVRLTEMAI